MCGRREPGQALGLCFDDRQAGAKGRVIFKCAESRVSHCQCAFLSFFFLYNSDCFSELRPLFKIC